MMCCSHAQHPGRNATLPWALWRTDWLFAGSLRSGKRAAERWQLSEHGPLAHLKDLLTRLLT